MSLRLAVCRCSYCQIIMIRYDADIYFSIHFILGAYIYVFGRRERRDNPERKSGWNFYLSLSGAAFYGVIYMFMAEACHVAFALSFALSLPVYGLMLFVMVRFCKRKRF